MATREAPFGNENWIEHRHQLSLLGGDSNYKKKASAISQSLNVRVNQFTLSHCGCSGFGANKKYKVVDHYDFDWDRGRRGYDDTRKNRKSAVNRFRRSERKLRTVNTTRKHEAEANLAFDHLPAMKKAYEQGEFLRSSEQPSPQGWWFMDLPFRSRLDFEEREWEEYLEQQHQDYINHMFNERYDFGYDDYVGPRLHEVLADHDFDPDYDCGNHIIKDDDRDYIAEVEDMIARHESEEERLIETLPIDHSGGHRGVKARMAANKNHTRPHHFFEVA